MKIGICICQKLRDVLCRFSKLLGLEPWHGIQVRAPIRALRNNYLLLEFIIIIINNNNNKEQEGIFLLFIIIIITNNNKKGFFSTFGSQQVLAHLGLGPTWPRWTL